MTLPTRLWLIVLGALSLGLGAADKTTAGELMSQGNLDRLGLSSRWNLDLAMDGGETVSRLALLDDNLYVLTDQNKVFAVHAPTGILRWSRFLAEPGQSIRGPSHNENHVFFTTGGAVVVLNRRTGDLASEPRSLRGVVIEVRHDTATISIGRAHGVRPDDIFKVVKLNEFGQPAGEPIAELDVNSVQERSAKGRLRRLDSGQRVSSGNRVTAEVALPLEKIDLPFAASSPAVADETRVYVGAANQRFYSLDILGGFQHWQLMTPKTVSASPALFGGQLYFGGQDGRVVCCTRENRVKNWTYETEGPIFADLVVTNERVFVASSDRSLYCLDRVTGERRWRERFDTPLDSAPIVTDKRLYQQVPQAGLFALDVATGEQLWRRPGGGRFLVQIEEDGYLVVEGSPFQVCRLDVATGRQKEAVRAGAVGFVAANQENQLILLASADGQLSCLRSRKAPHLRPEELAEAFRDDRKAGIASKVEADLAAQRAAKAGVAAPQKPRPPLFEDDWLSSRSTARPVGGRGLVPETTEPKGRQEAEDENGEADEESSTADEEEQTEDEGDTGDAEEDAETEGEEATAEDDEADSGDEEQSDEDSDGGEDDSGDEEGGDEEGGDDEGQGDGR